MFSSHSCVESCESPRRLEKGSELKTYLYRLQCVQDSASDSGDIAGEPILHLGYALEVFVAADVGSVHITGILTSRAQVALDPGHAIAGDLLVALLDHVGWYIVGVLAARMIARTARRGRTPGRRARGR